MRAISVRAVLIGGLIDIVLTFVLLLPIMMWAGVAAGVFELPEAEQADALLREFETNYGAYVVGVLLGSGASIVGGYVAARIANRAHLLNGALSAWFCFVMTAYAVLFDRSSLGSLWYLLFLPLAPALAALGGAVARRRAPRARVPLSAVKRASIRRRLVLTVVYLTAVLGSAALSGALLVSSACLETSVCTSQETGILLSVGLSFLVLAPLLLIAGLLGWLPGARHRRLAAADNEMTGA